MAKEHFFSQGTEYKQFNSENNSVTTISNPQPGMFYYSVFTFRNDVEFEGAAFHEKLAVKRTEDFMANTQNQAILSATNEYGTVEYNIAMNAPRFYTCTESEFESKKQEVLNLINQNS